jgi:hypothetical protein
MTVPAMLNKHIQLVITILIVSTLLCTGTGSENIKELESALKSYFDTIKLSTDDNEKRNINQKVIETFEKIFEEKNSFNHPFKTLSSLGKLLSSDKKVKIYTWNLSYSDGTHEYFGFVQYYSKKEKLYRWYHLTDKSDELNHPETLGLSNLNWFGALYYQVIDKQVDGKMYYALLGVDFNDLFSRKKLIDVIHFSENGDLLMGYPFFFHEKEVLSRVIFEFSPMVSMSLKYDEGRDMIIFDHLSPPDPIYKGQFHYYGPDSSYDGFRFFNGKWELVMDIDVRNYKPKF